MENIEALLSKLTVEEKANLCTGAGVWNTFAVERLGIPALLLTDGPHGLRKQQLDNMESFSYNSVPATCFPTAVGLASTWNRDLLYTIGCALAVECQAEDVAVLLGPGANIKRSPLCGRNFEYFSEDPFLSSHVAAMLIKGVQSGGVGTSLKHFAANNQETKRSCGSNSVIDERTLREIYLASFEYAVREAKPWTVMCSYNRLNGVYASQNEWLLTKLLREEWGFDGVVVSDWGAVDERVDALRAGLDLDMPSSNGINNAKLVAAVKSGALREEELNVSVRRILELVAKRQRASVRGVTFDKEAHHALARDAAREAIVLLKNTGALLPLRRGGERVAVIGEFAKNPRFQGGGSSVVRPTKTDCAWDAVCELAGAGHVAFAAGYSLAADATRSDLLEEAVQTARGADVAVLFVGLLREVESLDRADLRLPESHVKLIRAVAEVQPRVVVVLTNGAPVEMPWADCAPAVLETYLPGQAGGAAVVDVLFGACCPSGRLAETFPVKLSDTPPFPFYPEPRDAVYREGVLVGYRYYDTKELEPLFPFGHGLTYTEFEYSDLVVEKRQPVSAGVAVSVSLTVRNAGGMAGREVVQLYVHDPHAPVVRPQKELKEFAKVFLQPGESTRVQFELEKRSFAYYCVEAKDWRMHDKSYTILVGASSRDIRLRAEVQATTEKTKDILQIDRNTAFCDILKYDVLLPHVRDLFEKSGFGAMDKDGEIYEMMCSMSIRSVCRNASMSDKEMEAILDNLRRASQVLY